MNTKLLIKISLILIFTLIISIKLIKISNNYDESIDYLEENITISRNKNVLYVRIKLNMNMIHQCGHF